LAPGIQSISKRANSSTIYSGPRPSNPTALLFNRWLHQKKAIFNSALLKADIEDVFLYSSKSYF
jgi:hypothetical protein